MLILVRHGRPENGPADPPLRSDARTQAARLGERIRSLGHPAFVLTSPALRTNQTAETLGLGATRVRSELAPRRTGTAAPRGAAAWDERPDGGESLRDVADRLRAPLAEWITLLRSGAGDVGVVVSHSEVLFVLRSLIEEHWSRDPLILGDDGRAIHTPGLGSAVLYRFLRSGARPFERTYVRAFMLTSDAWP